MRRISRLSAQKLDTETDFGDLETMIPERKLLWSVLFLAMQDFLGPKVIGGTLKKYREAAYHKLQVAANNWLFDESDTETEFTFHWVARHLFAYPEDAVISIRKFLVSPNAAARFEHMKINRYVGERFFVDDSILYGNNHGGS